MHSKTTGSILVYMDDDDYYPPERVDHAVDMLRIHKTAMIAGSSEIYIYFKHIQKMYQCGPYGKDHATAGTFAFRRQLLNETQYDENACLAEEKMFLRNFTVPMVQLDPLKTILVFSHIHNTFDKRNMLENMHPQYFSESTKTVDDFIRQESENNIRQFFMNDIDDKLKDYQPGEPVMKPDVLEQIAEIDEHRKQIMASQPAPQIMIDISGEERRPMTPHEIVKALSQQQEHIKLLTSRVRELEHILELA